MPAALGQGSTAAARTRPVAQPVTAARWLSMSSRTQPRRVRRASFRYADDARRGTVIGNPDLAARTPVVVVRFEGHVERLVVLVAIAQTTAALAFAATIVVGDDVVVAVGGIVAGSDPGDGRGFGPRRAALGRASAAGAQESVDGTVSPVLAGLRVTGIRGGAPRATGNSGTPALNSRALMLPRKLRRETRRARSRVIRSTNASRGLPASGPREVTAAPGR